MQQIRSAHDETGSTRAVHLYQIIDYRGQNMSELADWLDRFRNDDRSPFHPSRIDVVLLLVDLFETPDGVERGSASAPEAGRVGLHTSEWGNLILDIVLRYVRWERLSCLCLFVNKLDLLASPDPAGDAKAAFEPLLQRLAKRAETARHRREEQRPGERFRPIETVCLAGSLRSGQGVPELERALRRAGRTPQLAGAGDA
jgi:hypothetical protein